MDFPARKQIRLKDYDYTQNNAYFITICTYKRATLFGYIVDGALQSFPNSPDKMVEKWLMELENKFENLYLDDFIVMPNHIHFVVFNHSGKSIAEVADWFKTMTTNDYISHVKSGAFPAFKERIWQRNYYEHVVRNDEDLFESRRYIEENPLKWELDELYIASKV